MTNETRARVAPRLRPWPVKLAFVVAGGALVYLSGAIPLAPGGTGILRSTLAFALVLLGARLFRGADEDIAPARPWWRMTAAVPAGIVLGTLFALVTLASAVAYVGVTASTLPHRDVADLPALLVNILLAALLGYLYFGSSRRLVLARRKLARGAGRALS